MNLFFRSSGIFYQIPFRFLEFPSSLKYSTLSMYMSQHSKRKLPTHFGWLTEPGLYTGIILNMKRFGVGQNLKKGEKYHFI